MFQIKSIFGGIACPVQDQCAVLNCVFSHEVPKSQREFEDLDKSMPNKRQKIDNETEFALRVDSVVKPATAKEDISDVKARSLPNKNVTRKAFIAAKTSTKASRSISPPPISRSNPETSTETKSKTSQEALNPRRLQHDPASHQTRHLYLRKLHEEMGRLNSLTKRSTDKDIRVLALKDGELITKALDEEQKIALQNPSVYANIIKLRMVAYKKMTLEQWKKARLEELVVPAKELIKSERNLTTGLTDTQERNLVRQFLLVKQRNHEPPLEKHGYTIDVPSEDALAKVRIAIREADGWETCDRCKSHFQVFPDRRDDGTLTSGGKCTYHHGKITNTGSRGARESTYTCCQELIGRTPGCSCADSHVFKVNDTERLATILQYARTPLNPTLNEDRAVSFDCEMGFTVHGMEVLRVTALSWPKADTLLDVLVRPIGAVLDFNTRYSGISAETFRTAKPYSHQLQHSLSVVESPAAARDLLFALITPSTPLIGHAIENDLNTLRIVHPSIVDTVLLFPHPRGLPRRRALRHLAAEMLERTIQTGGAEGHDSREDARATGDLVREKVKRTWKHLKGLGWTVVDGMLTAPEGKQARDVDVLNELEEQKVESGLIPTKRGLEEMEERHDDVDTPAGDLATVLEY